MMKLKMMAVLAVIGTTLSACSNNPTNYPYTQPYNAYGYNGFQSGYNSLYPNNGFNYNYNIQNPFLYSNNSALTALQTQAYAQAMFSMNFRMRSPMFYMQNYTSNNCLMRSQVNFTPSNCACIMAPCNCAQTLNQLSQTRIRRARTVTTTTDASTTPSTPTSTNDHSNHDHSTDVTTTNSAKLVSLSVVKADARALYERLAKEEETLPNKTKMRVGTNYKCFMSGKAKKDESYACDFDVNLEDGSLYQLYPMGKPGQPVLVSSMLFNGLNVSVGGPGLAPEEGFIKFNGKLAAAIFNRLPGQSTTGTIDDQDKVQAEIKTGKSVKCYKTVNTANSIVECSIKIKSDSGDAMDAQAN